MASWTTNRSPGTSRRGSRSRRRLLAPLVVVFLVGALPGSAQATTVTFNPTGAQQTFTVPAGVTSIHVVAIGAPGGAGAPFGFMSAGGAGANGAAAAADLAVTAGEVLYVEVGRSGGTRP